MKNRKSRLARTAFHEAGHAVAAFLNGRKIIAVTIVPGEDYLGRVRYPGWTDDQIDELQTGSAESLRVRRLTEVEIMTALAGTVAEELAYGTSGDTGWERDRSLAAELASMATGNLEECEAYLGWLMCRVKAQLSHRRNWPLVRVLVDELLRKSTLSGSAVRRLLKQTRQKQFIAWSQRSGNAVTYTLVPSPETETPA